MTAELTLQPELLERLAQRIADLVADRIAAGPPLLTAEALARHLDVSTAYVYEHAQELCARRLGRSPKARLRFTLEDVQKRLDSCSTGRGSKDGASAVVEPIRRACRSRPIGTGPDLLPVRGSENTKEEQ